MSRSPLETANVMVHGLEQETPATKDAEKTKEKRISMNELSINPHTELGQTRSPGLQSMLLIARIILAGIFIFSGLAKLGFLGTLGNTPVEFATAIRKFEIVNYDLIPYLAFIIPWTEIVCGLALLFGLASRAAAIVIKIMLSVFTIGFILIMVRGLKIENCQCFGGRLTENFGIWGMVFEPPTVPLSILRNVILMGLCLLIAWRGSGYLGLDWFMAKPARAAA